jgi:hypothetical protein
MAPACLEHDELTSGLLVIANPRQTGEQSTNKHGASLYGERQAFACARWWIASSCFAALAVLAMTEWMIPLQFIMPSGLIRKA